MDENEVVDVKETEKKIRKPWSLKKKLIIAGAGLLGLLVGAVDRRSR
jgi:hypothetical protein